MTRLNRHSFSGTKIIRNEDIYTEDNLRLVFKELGFSEVYNYPFIGKMTRKI